MTLANIVTLVRIAFIPIFIFLFFFHGGYSRLLVAAVFVLTGISDAVDGYLARSRKEVSRLGILIDPLADKLVMATAFISLGIIGKLPWWLAGVLIGKELALVLGAVFFYVSKDQVVSSSWLGKVTTVILYVGVTLVIVDIAWARAIVFLGVGLSVLAGLDYLRRILPREGARS